MKHEVYTWVHRVNANNRAGASLGWRCSCGTDCKKPRFPTREAALKDAERHQEGT